MHTLLQGFPSPGDTAVVRSTVAAAATAGEAVALSLALDSLAESPSACTAPSEPAACAEGAQATNLLTQQLQPWQLQEQVTKQQWQ